MLCFSVIAQRRVYIAPAGFYPPASVVVADSEPEVTPGIAVSRRTGKLAMYYEIDVDIDPELLAADPAAGHVRHENENIVILRASYDKDASGKIRLVPETDARECGAIALVDAGRGIHSAVKLAKDAPGVLALTNRPSDLLSGREEIALLHLIPHWPVGVLRTNWRWLFFGDEIVQEVLYLKTDGQNITVDLMR